MLCNLNCFSLSLIQLKRLCDKITQVMRGSQKLIYYFCFLFINKDGLLTIFNNSFQFSGFHFCQRIRIFDLLWKALNTINDARVGCCLKEKCSVLDQVFLRSPHKDVQLSTRSRFDEIIQFLENWILNSLRTSSP